MSFFWPSDPGECPICGAAHTACTAGGKNAPIVGGPITSAQSIAVPQPASHAAPAPAPPLAAELAQATLPPGQVTTGTYRRVAQSLRDRTKGAKTT